MSYGGGGGGGGRKMTPKGQMSSSGSGPAIMMMPNHIRATFMPDPPLLHLPPPKRRRPKLVPDDRLQHDDDENDAAKKKPKRETETGLTGLAKYMSHFERTAPPERKVHPTGAAFQAARAKKRASTHRTKLAPLLRSYREQQSGRDRDGSAAELGEYNGMNCYNTLFVGRLAYEVTERKLLRELEAFGPIKDLKLIFDSKNGRGKSRGYAFVEYEQEEDMKRAYRGADGMRVEGREIVVDVERGHTVPNWLPRRLGGGLGGTRLGGKDKNVTTPGRYDPNKPPPQGPPVGHPPPHHGMMGGSGYGGNGNGGPSHHPPPHLNGGGGGGGHYGPPGGYGGYGGGGGGYDRGGGGYDRGGGPRGRGPHGAGGGYGGGPPPRYGGGGGGPPPGYGGGYGGGGGGGRGPPPGYNGPPPQQQGGRYGGGPPHRGDRGGGMKRGRSRSWSPERRDRRGRY